MYLVGGNYFHPRSSLSLVQVIDKHLNKTKASSMNVARKNFNMCEFDNRYLLVAGGSVIEHHSSRLGLEVDIEVTSTKSCEIYDSISDKWDKTSELTEFRSSFSLVYFNKKILIIGGRSEHNSKILDTIESYDVKTRKW